MNKTKIQRTRRSPRPSKPRTDIPEIAEVSSDDEVSSSDESHSRRGAVLTTNQRRKQDGAIIDPFGAFIQFRVIVSFTEKMDYTAKSITLFDQDWNTISHEKITLASNMIRAIITGERSSITVIKFKRNCALYKTLSDELLYNTFQVQTPNGSVHIYFKYDSRLISIYESLPGVSVFNDNRYVLGGDRYTVSKQSCPIIDMPSTLFNTLHEAQSRPVETFKAFDEIVSLLNDSWIKETNKLRSLTLALRNSNCGRDMIIATLRKMIVDRNGWYDSYQLERLLEESMTYLKKRYTLLKLKRDLKDEIGEDEFNRKLNAAKEQIREQTQLRFIRESYPRLKHEPGVTTKLQEIKDIYPDLTAKKLLLINEAFMNRRIDACKQCGNRYHKSCCNRSSRETRTKQTVIDNLMIIE